MKKTILLLFVTAIIFSCKTEVTEVVNLDENNTEAIAETASQISPKEATKEEIQFNFLEDYATLNNREALVEAFGEVNLSDYIMMLAEGTVKKNATKVINPKNWHHIIYTWNDDTQETESVEAGYYLWSSVGEIKGSQKVESKNGLYTGMLLEDFVSWNGADIEFAGFGWDYAGNVFPDQEGQLATSKVDVVLINKQESYDGFDFMIGDVVLNSREERLKEAPVVIETLSLSLINEEE